jgi:flagellar biogenesis protein FliO
VETLRQVLGVTAVLALLGITLWWLRKRGLAYIPSAPGRRRTGALESVERLALSPTHALHLVRLGDRALVVATSPAGCQLMESLPWKDLGGEGAPRL